MDDKEIRLYQRGLGLASPRLNERLAERAERERNLRRPWYPAISCAATGCDRVAIEMWYFCCRNCRDDYVLEFASESAAQ